MAKTTEQVSGVRVNVAQGDFKKYDVYPWELLKDARFKRAWKKLLLNKNFPNWVRDLNVVASKESTFFCATNYGDAILYSGTKIHDGEKYLRLIYFPKKNLIAITVEFNGGESKRSSNDESFLFVDDLENNFCKGD
ncbi:hypothetical protein [uncultured Rhodoferax sp.]|uniref:hypothetical protein n=1 Tax=uncultured Rhodoferax sp. TaxID=223188 RepID=UPI0025D89026|nr:hypothetical protein [uncultured Rhodoferax sp.]